MRPGYQWALDSEGWPEDRAVGSTYYQMAPGLRAALQSLYDRQPSTIGLTIRTGGWSESFEIMMADFRVAPRCRIRRTSAGRSPMIIGLANSFSILWLILNQNMASKAAWRAGVVFEQLRRESTSRLHYVPRDLLDYVIGPYLG